MRSGGINALKGASAAVLATGVLLAATISATSAARSLSYVALGDSYTSGPGISPASPTAPARCAQSAKNYPHVVAAANHWNLTDASCSGATSADMTASQFAGAAPQFDALSTSTNVVTIGIGGNDDDLFMRALVSCGVTDIADFFNFGSPCKAIFGNTFANDVSSDASRVGGVLGGIHSRAPHAKVFVVGYPDILPERGGCYPSMPLTTGDTTYLNGLEQDLNAMLASEARAHDATFIDTFTPTIGHDACEPAGVRWINPIIASGGGISVHPNPAGVASIARIVEAALRAKGL